MLLGGVNIESSFLYYGLAFMVGTFTKRLWRGCRQILFTLLAEPLGWSEVTVKDSDTVATISRCLRRVYFTRREIYLHSANVVIKDGIMHGTYRLPTISWFVWFLSVMDTCNYIYIDDETKFLHAIGPSDVMNSLIEDYMRE